MLTQEAQDALKYLYSLASAAADYRVKFYAPYYRDFATLPDVWTQAIEEAIPDEIDREALKAHFELVSEGLLEFLGSDGSIAQFQFTRAGFEFVRKLLEQDET